MLLCEGQQNWLRVVTVVFRIYVTTSTFLLFYVFQNPKSRDFLRFLPCFARFLELCLWLNDASYRKSVWRSKQEMAYGESNGHVKIMIRIRLGHSSSKTHSQWNSSISDDYLTYDVHRMTYVYVWSVLRQVLFISDTKPLSVCLSSHVNADNTRMMYSSCSSRHIVIMSAHVRTVDQTIGYSYSSWTDHKTAMTHQRHSANVLWSMA